MSKQLSGTVTAILLLFGGADIMAESQASLDAACEAAREKKLVPWREQMTRDCIAEGKKDKNACEKEFVNHNGRIGKRPLPYYDLPECEKATKNKQSVTR